MDHVRFDDDLEKEIEAVMAELGIDRLEAMLEIGLRHGQRFGDGDLVPLRPLTEEQQRRLGLGRTLDEVLAEERALKADQNRTKRRVAIPASSD